MSRIGSKEIIINLKKKQRVVIKKIFVVEINEKDKNINNE